MPIIQHLFLNLNFPLIKLFSIPILVYLLPFKLFHAAFSKTLSHGHSVEKLSIKTINQFYFDPHLPLRFSIFIHDCIECQTNKHFPI